MRHGSRLGCLVGVLLLIVAGGLALAGEEAPPRVKREKDTGGVSSIEVPAGWKVERDNDTVSASPGLLTYVVLICQPKGDQTLAKWAESVADSIRRKEGSKLRKREAVAIGGLPAQHLQAQETMKLPPGMPLDSADMVTDYYLVQTARHQLALTLKGWAEEAEENNPTFQAIVASWQLHGEAREPGPQPPQPPEPPRVKREKDTSGVSSIEVPADWTIERDDDCVLASPGPPTYLFLRCQPKEEQTLQQWADSLADKIRHTEGSKLHQREAVEIGGLPAHHIRVKETEKLLDVPVDTVADYYLVQTARHQLILFLKCWVEEAEEKKPTLQAILASWKLPRGEGPPPPGLKQVQGPGDAFTLSVPAKWTVQEEKDDGGLSAYDPTSLRRTTLVRVVPAPKTAQSVEQLATQCVDFLQQQVGNWAETRREELLLAGCQAVRILATGKEEGTDLTLDCYVVLGTARQFLILAVCPTKSLAQRRPTLGAIVASWRPGQGPVPVAMRKVADPSGTVSFSVPKDWAEQRIGAVLSYQAPQAGVNVSLMCTQVLVPIPYEQYVGMLVQNWKMSLPGFRLLSQKAVQVSGHAMSYLETETQLPIGARATNYLLGKVGPMQVMLTLTCGKADLEKFKGIFDQIVQSVQLRAPAGPGVPR